MKEIWKDVPGYEKYEVSNTGKVRNKERFYIDSKGRYVHRKARLLRPAICHKGYKFVVLYDENLKTKTIKVHRLVTEAFVPNPNNYPQINHVDTNKQNNFADNLEWCTNAQNITHAYKNGLITHLPKGEKHHNSTLSDAQVEWIRKNCIKGDRDFGTRALGRKFGVANITISRIVNSLSRVG